jgi:hypothetical protein
MTHETHRLLAAYRRSGLAFLGIGFERALSVKAIRIALECAVKAETQGKPAPSQPALI